MTPRRRKPVPIDADSEEGMVMLEQALDDLGVSYERLDVDGNNVWIIIQGGSERYPMESSEVLAYILGVRRVHDHHAMWLEMIMDPPSKPNTDRLIQSRFLPGEVS
jgi:hypothetical protein